MSIGFCGGVAEMSMNKGFFEVFPKTTKTPAVFGFDPFRRRPLISPATAGKQTPSAAARTLKALFFALGPDGAGLDVGNPVIGCNRLMGQRSSAHRQKNPGQGSQAGDEAGLPSLGQLFGRQPRGRAFAQILFAPA